MIKIKKIRETKLNSDYFDVEKTLSCGQCFRFTKEGSHFVGIIGNSLVDIEQTPEGIFIHIYGEDLSDEFLMYYFDMNRNYQEILNTLRTLDVHMKSAVDFGRGIRILNQDPFETLISFIVSSNNNIPKIKMTLEALSEKFGTPLGAYNGKTYFSFPRIQDLINASEEDLNVKAIGYRAKSIYRTCQIIEEKQIDLNAPFGMDYIVAREWLKQFYGVGDKVADCILLFAYVKDDAFPVDTWVKRMLGELYHIEKDYGKFINSYFNAYKGIAQQYLFYYMRNLKKIISTRE